MCSQAYLPCGDNSCAGSAPAAALKNNTAARTMSRDAVPAILILQRPVAVPARSRR